MERDFLGLSVKQETPDEAASDAAPFRSSSMQWSFPNKASNVPHLLSFQEDTVNGAGFGSLASTGLVAIMTDAFDSDHKPYVAPQKSVVPGVVQYGVMNYPAKHVDSLQNIHRSVTAQKNLKIAPPGPNLSLGSQPLASVPSANPVTAIPSSSTVVGSTDLRNGSKTSGAATQLTIFYNGSVCVFDNISPDKAQAIMLLAGNGPPAPPVLDPFPLSQPYVATPHQSSPLRVTPLSIAPPAVRSSTNKETIPAKPTGVFMPSSVIAEPLRSTKLVGSVSAKFLSSDTVPQFRKKSLARFLEKRKERVGSASPYANKESADCR